MCKNLFMWFTLPLLVTWPGIVLGDDAGNTMSPVVSSSQAERINSVEKLGKLIFFDKNLSANQNQSCATCHSAGTGWTGPESGMNALGAVYMGSVDGRFGNRKPPSIAYAGDCPTLHLELDSTWIGGMFWNGRATGRKLNDPLAEQAQFPFTNPLEQALTGPAAVVEQVCKASYMGLFKEVWGKDACTDVDKAYEYIARSIAAFERSEEVNSFSSKYDYFLQGKVSLSPEEEKGLELFNDKGKCARCHPSTVGPHNPEHPFFTTFKYDNVGVPKNPLNPFYYNSAFNPKGVHWIDLGLGGFLNLPSELGKQKIPTLRNVDKRPYSIFVKAYGHNGYFKTLESFVHFYNNRDVLRVCSEPLAENDIAGENCWPPAEVPENVVRTEAWWPAELGNLTLTAEEEACIVAFLKTLSDGWNEATGNMAGEATSKN